MIFNVYAGSIWCGTLYVNHKYIHVFITSNNHIHAGRLIEKVKEYKRLRLDRIE